MKLSDDDYKRLNHLISQIVLSPYLYKEFIQLGMVSGNSYGYNNILNQIERKLYFETKCKKKDYCTIEEILRMIDDYHHSDDDTEYIISSLFGQAVEHVEYMAKYQSRLKFKKLFDKE